MCTWYPDEHVLKENTGENSKKRSSERHLWLRLKVKRDQFWEGDCGVSDFIGLQNKSLIAATFLSASAPPLCDGTATSFSQKDAFYGPTACWQAASVCSADFNCLSVAIKEPVKYTTVKELQARAQCILGTEMNKAVAQWLMGKKWDNEPLILKLQLLDAFLFGKDSTQNP